MTFHGLTYPIRKIYYRFRLFKKFWKSYFAPWDIGESMLKINMELFCEFYDYGGIKLIDWDSDWNDANISVKSQMNEIYNWWRIERPKRIEEKETVLETWAEHYVNWWSPFVNGYSIYNHIETKYAKYLNNLYTDLERSLYNEEENYLMMLMKIRNYLWT